MQHEALSVLISEQRLSTYYKMFHGDKHKAFEYYQLNIQIAQSLYPMLLYTEVSLRNLIHHSCSIHFKNDHWFELCAEQRDRILRIESTIRKKNNLPNIILPDAIIAELTFGFWCSLFNKSNARYFWKPLQYAFPYLDHSMKRERLSLKLNHIRRLRNRIYHYEPICNDLEILWQNYLNMMDVLRAMNPELIGWAKALINFEQLYKKAKKMRSDRFITDASCPK